MSDQNPYQPPSTEVPASRGNLALEGASVTASMLDELRATRPWVRFISVMGFIATGLVGVVGIGMGAAAAFGFADDVGGLPGVLVAVLYVVLVGVFYLLPTLRLNRYAGALGRVFSQGGVASIEEALRSQASFWRLMGILVIIGLAVAVLAVIVMVVVGIVTAVAAAQS